MNFPQKYQKKERPTLAVCGLIYGEFLYFFIVPFHWFDHKQFFKQI